MKVFRGRRARGRRTLVFMLGIGLFAIIAGAAGAGAPPTPLPGLEGEALVVFDSNAVPHICASSDRDAYFLQGYVHARDRFFQMDFLRRTFSGTLAELVGPAALGSDVQFRTLGLRRAAEESLAGFAARGLDDGLEMLEAYAAGVNAYLDRGPLPPEYAVLELAGAAPWTPVDSLVLGKGLAFGLSFDLLELDLTLQAIVYTEAGLFFGFDGLALLLEDVSRPAPFDPVVSIPPGSGKATSPPGLAARLAAPAEPTSRLARQVRERMAEVPLLARALDGRRRSENGSNWWILSGEKSATGHPMLANDPHLGLDTPAIFYEAHLFTTRGADCGLEELAAGGETLAFSGGEKARHGRGDLDVNGVTFAGAPGVILGCNDTACWGATTNPMDVTDVYQEVLILDPETGVPTHTVFDGQPEPVVIIPQTFLVNQIGDGVAGNLADAGIGPGEGGLTILVPRRNHGPILAFDPFSQPVIGLSVQYAGWRDTYELEAFRRFQHADSLEDFRNGLGYFDVGSQNFAYADVAGNIAYFTSAEMPLREDLQLLGFPDGGIPPFFIRDGTHTLRHEWLPLTDPQPMQALDYQILPFAEMPQIVNPAAGYVANANNDPVGTTLDNDPLNQARPGGGIYYLSPGYTSLRMGRIERLLEDLLEGGGKATREDLERMQANNQLLDAELVSPFLVAAYDNAAVDGAPAALAALAADPAIAEAIGRLREWDFSTPTGIPEGYDPGDDPKGLQAPSAGEIEASVAATIWSAYRGQLTRGVVDATLERLGLGDFLPASDLAYKGVAHLLRTWETGEGIGASGVDFFPVPAPGLTRAEGRDLILLQLLRATLDLLASDEFAPAFGNSTDQDDYRWGYLHRIVFDHPLGGPFSIPPAAGFDHLAPDLPGLSRAGGFQAVDASGHSARADGLNDFMFGSGPARRFVGVLDPAGIDAEEILPGGQSGVLGSPHYASQLSRWLTNRYHPMLSTPAAIAGDAAVREGFEPTCVPDAFTHCFLGGRFRATAQWSSILEIVQPARAVPGASDLSGNFYFVSPANWEMLVKVLDGCAVNGHFWVFNAAATDLAWDLVVEDTETGQVWTASNPLGTRSPAITDTSAFATCP